MTDTEQTEAGKIPEGKYTFVGIDIDTTGRRILDEIVHIAAYSPKEQFDQFVIPVMNLNPAARQRHQLRVITVGFFRMLKCTLTNKVLKSKTEIVALKAFLDWLEERKKADTGSNGVVLMCHESIKFAPYMLLESLKKYDLLDRFSKVVTGFVDGQALTEAKCANDAKASTLRELAKMVLNTEDKDDAEHFEGNAMVRAKIAYEVVEHFAKAAENGDENITTDLVQGFVHSVNMDINELTDQNKCIDLQQTFRPVFVAYFKTNLYHRYKAVTFRRVLAENGFDLNKLEAVWNEKKKDGLTEIVSKLDDIKEENRQELIDILDSYFDPEKETIVPAVKKTPPTHNRRGYRRGGNKENHRRRGRTNGNKTKQNGDLDENDEPQSSDSTRSSPRKNRRSRRRSVYTKQQKQQANGETETTKDQTALGATILTEQPIGNQNLPEIAVA